MSKRSCVIRMSVLLALLPAVAGCGFFGGAWALPTQQAVLAPEPLPARIGIGAGAQVHVIVIDEREAKLVGYQKHGHFSRIVSLEDLATVLRGRLEKGLANLGFELLAAPDPSATTLAVRLVTFSYNVEHFWRSARSGATALIIRDSAAVFEKRYEPTPLTERSKLSGLVGADSVDQQVNAMLNDLVAKVLGDLELLHMLRSGPGIAPAPQEGPPRVVDLRVSALVVSESDPAVEVPENVRGLFADRLPQLLPAEGALAHDLRIVYRFVHYDPGSRFLRSLTGREGGPSNLFGNTFSEKGKGAITVEATFFDSEGGALGTLQVEGTTLHQGPECEGGCPFDLAVQNAAEQVAAYVRGNFLKPRQ